MNSVESIFVALSRCRRRPSYKRFSFAMCIFPLYIHYNYYCIKKTKIIKKRFNEIITGKREKSGESSAHNTHFYHLEHWIKKKKMFNNISFNWNFISITKIPQNSRHFKIVTRNFIILKQTKSHAYR